MAIEMTVEQLKKEFDANDGVISAIKCEGFTKFTCRNSGASWAVIKTEKSFEIIAEFIRGAAFSYSKVNAILEKRKLVVSWTGTPRSLIHRCRAQLKKLGQCTHKSVVDRNGIALCSLHDNQRFNERLVIKQGNFRLYA